MYRVDQAYGCGVCSGLVKNALSPGGKASAATEAYLKDVEGVQGRDPA